MDNHRLHLMCSVNHHPEPSTLAYSFEYAVKEKQVTHLWALEKNVKAIKFYERHGFYLTKEKELEEGTTEYLVKLEKKYE